ncbi:hypothetical protein [Luteolibacter sp. AS25]|uniref:hypothetical protein n=1 Tax=Luteolibacter sp. AS25 TaxID=3135776 RepID=UPI00398AE4D6
MEEGSDSQEQSGKRVNKRLVFYFSGFDPRGPSHYQKLYSAESKLQEPLNGLSLKVGKRRKTSDHTHGWDIKLEGAGTKTEYEFLRWDDLIRKYWPKNEWELMKAAIPVYWNVLVSNHVPRLYKVSWSAAFTIAYPIIAFFGLFLAAAILGIAAMVLPLAFGQAWWWGILPAVAIGYGSLHLSRYLDRKFRTYWLLRTYCMLHPWGGGKLPEIDQRIEEFAGYIVDKIKNTDADEVLLAGHSAGSVLTVPLVRRMLELYPGLGKKGPEFGLLSLGNCQIILSFFPGPKQLRKDLETVALADGVQWLDFSAKRDGACVSMVDPLEANGIKRPNGVAVRPQLHPVRIVKMFSPERYAVIKKDIFRVHFQYVMAGEMLTDYDFFAITAGPQKLSERFPQSLI